VIEDRGEVLIAQRKSTDSFEAGKWEFPGGKVDFAENPELAVCREIKEELNLDVQVERLIGTRSQVYDSESSGNATGHSTESASEHVFLLFYRCRLSSQQASDLDASRDCLQLLDAADARWVRIRDLAEFDFAAADREMIAYLIKNGL
jgi:8-oxo-dGTP diphosphatase